jgi:hypothetical protein
MPKCRNPECQKELPEGRVACNETCMRKSFDKRTDQGQKLTSEENIWFGQARRKRAMDSIIKLARELCPIQYKKFVGIVCFRTGLSLRKVTDDFLEILLELGLLKLNEGILTLNEAKPP